MFATIRRIALAVAGAAALIAAAKARADHDQDRWRPPASGAPAAIQSPAYASPAYAPPPAPVRPAPALSLAVALPAPPAWLAITPPSYPIHGTWTRQQLAQEYRWLDKARVRFYRRGAWSPWRVRQFEAWYQARRADLDRRWTALAWAPAYRDGGRADRWDGHGDAPGRWGRERRESGND